MYAGCVLCVGDILCFLAVERTILLYILDIISASDFWSLNKCLNANLYLFLLVLNEQGTHCTHAAGVWGVLTSHPTPPATPPPSLSLVNWNPTQTLPPWHSHSHSHSHSLIRRTLPRSLCVTRGQSLVLWKSNHPYPVKKTKTTLWNLAMIKTKRRINFSDQELRFLQQTV